MRRRTRGIINAVLFIGLFVILPRVIVSRLPAELLRMLSMAALDVDAIVLGLTIPGLALALLALVGGFVEPRSPVNLVIAISSQLVWFYLFLFTIGLGNPWTFGQSQIFGGGGPAAITFILDTRFFVALAALILGLKIVKMSLEYLSMRRQPPAQPPLPAQIPPGSEAVKGVLKRCPPIIELRLIYSNLNQEMRALNPYVGSKEAKAFPSKVSFLS